MVDVLESSNSSSYSLEIYFDRYLITAYWQCATGIALHEGEVSAHYIYLLHWQLEGLDEGLCGKRLRLSLLTAVTQTARVRLLFLVTSHSALAVVINFINAFLAFTPFVMIRSPLDLEHDVQQRPPVPTTSRRAMPYVHRTPLRSRIRFLTRLPEAAERVRQLL